MMGQRVAPSMRPESFAALKAGGHPDPPVPSQHHTSHPLKAPLPPNPATGAARSAQLEYSTHLILPPGDDGCSASGPDGCGDRPIVLYAQDGTAFSTTLSLLERAPFGSPAYCALFGAFNHGVLVNHAGDSMHLLCDAEVLSAVLEHLQRGYVSRPLSDSVWAKLAFLGIDASVSLFHRLSTPLAPGRARSPMRAKGILSTPYCESAHNDRFLVALSPGLLHIVDFARGDQTKLTYRVPIPPEIMDRCSDVAIAHGSEPFAALYSTMCNWVYLVNLETGTIQTEWNLRGHPKVLSISAQFLACAYANGNAFAYGHDCGGSMHKFRVRMVIRANNPALLNSSKVAFIASRPLFPLWGDTLVTNLASDTNKHTTTNTNSNDSHNDHAGHLACIMNAATSACLRCITRDPTALSSPHYLPHPAIQYCDGYVAVLVRDGVWLVLSGEQTYEVRNNFSPYTCAPKSGLCLAIHPVKDNRADVCYASAINIDSVPASAGVGGSDGGASVLEKRALALPNFATWAGIVGEHGFCVKTRRQGGHDFHLFY